MVYGRWGGQGNLAKLGSVQVGGRLVSYPQRRGGLATTLGTPTLLRQGDCDRTPNVVTSIDHPLAPATSRSACPTRNSPDTSLGSSASRRAARVRDSWIEARIRETSGLICSVNAQAT